MNKEQFKLTESGLRWLKIDMANTFGLDKLSHDEQVVWADGMIAEVFGDYKIQNGVHEYISQAESPFEFRQTLENYEMYINDKPVNGLMYVDCSNQALQVYAFLTGDLKTAQVSNMAGESKRTDGYQMLADRQNSHFTEEVVTRAMAKKPMMTTLYGKQNAWDSMLDELSKKLDTDVYSDEFQEQMSKIFDESMLEIAPNAMKSMAQIQALNDEKIGTYYWTLPDGFKVKYDVKSKTRVNVERTTKSGLNISIEDEVEEYKPSKYNAGMAPNVIHSVDGYIVRELIRRSDYHFTSIHDAFGQHYNFVDTTIKNFKDICIELLKSDLLNDILTEIADGRPFQRIEKSSTLTSFHIRKSKYALS